MKSLIIAENYGWSSDNAELSHSYLLPTTINLLKLHNVKSLLDIGCGNGSTLPIWLAQGIKVAAMEPDTDGYKYAKQHVGADVRKLGVGEDLPEEWKNSFDSVVSLEVIEHLFDPIQLVKDASLALKKDGIVIISTPYHGYIKNLALAFMGKWDFHHHPLRTGGHIKFWSKATLSELFIKEGFELITFKGVGRLPFVWKSMIMVFKKTL